MRNRKDIWASFRKATINPITLGVTIFLIGAGVLTYFIVVYPEQNLPTTRKERIAFELASNKRESVWRGIQTFAGLGFIATAYFAWRNSQLTEDKNVADRFSKAVEMLSDGRLEMRLGGIYSLERIARDSKKDHPVVMEVLTAFIRNRSPIKTPKQDSFVSSYMPYQEAPSVKKIDQDIQITMSVICRNKTDYDKTILEVDLSGANLAYAKLSGANLSYAKLGSANLGYANLSDANLSRTSLIGANLSGAILLYVNLSYANLSRANLRESYFRKANLSGANLLYADLLYADLRGANLSGADLSGANLSGANLSGANLLYADLRGANLFYTNFGGADLSGSDLRGASLSGTNLSNTNLSNTNLREAFFFATDLRYVKNLLPEQLKGKKQPILCNVALPTSAIAESITSNRDCDRIPQILSDRYIWMSPEQAQELVEKALQKT
jgi:uncharacterized protein YjbI with pentapeptide repeats